MANLDLRLVGDAALLEPHYVRAGSQKDNLCGCFWANLALAAFAGVDFADEEDAALVAGVVVPEGPTDPASSLPWGGAGAVAPTGPYRLALPTSADDAAIGTSAHGVARAVQVLSEGRLDAVPVRSQRWTADLVVAVLDRLAAMERGDLLVVANIATEHLGPAARSLVEILGHLGSGPALAERPPDWAVGHFSSLAGLAVGPKRTLVVVRDTYKALGFGGYHAQEPERVAAALHRSGTGAGGVLLVGGTETVSLAAAALDGLPLTRALWDNGSPPPPPA